MGDTDMELLGRFADTGDEAAFEELLRRHLDLVYSAAARQAGSDPQAAEDIAQAVFVDLARKAPRLRGHTSLTGWLYTAVRHAAATHRRAEARRAQRERTALSMNADDATPGPEPDWNRLRPLLDEAMHALSDTDREAVLLRCFERRPYSEVGARLGIAENAARMRVDRALGRLGELLAHRGVTSTAAGLALALEAHAVATAPEGLHAAIRTACPVPSASSRSAVGPRQRGIPMGVGVAILLVLGIGILGLVDRRSGRNPIGNEGLGTDSTTAGLQADPPTVKSGGRDRNSTAVGSVLGAAAATTSSKLRVRFLDFETRKPLPGVAVRVPAPLDIEPDDADGESNADGVAEIDWLPGSPGPDGVLFRSILEGYADTLTRIRTPPSESRPVEVLLPKAVEIGGLVTDAAGSPLEGVRVTWRHGAQETPDAQPVIPSGQTVEAVDWGPVESDAAGRWTLRRLSARHLESLIGTFTKPGWVPFRESPATHGAQGELGRLLRSQEHRVQMSGGWELSGEVVDHEGTAVPDAEVVLDPGRNASSLRSRTDAQGRFHLHALPTGPSTLLVHSWNRGSHHQRLELARSTNLGRIRLAEPVPLQIRIVDQQDHGVDSARIHLEHHPQPDFARAEDQELSTDAEGRAGLSSMPDGELVLHVSGGDRGGAVERLRAGTREARIRLRSPLGVVATVKEEETGDPIANFEVEVGFGVPDPREPSRIVEFVPRAGKPTPVVDGRFHEFLQSHPLGGAGTQRIPILLRIGAEGRQRRLSRPFLLEEGNVELVIRLPRTSGIRVRVEDPDGRPIAGAQVGLLGVGTGLRIRPSGILGLGVPAKEAVLVSDSSGRFPLPENPGEAKVLVCSRPEGFAQISSEILKSKPVLRLERWGTVEGEIAGIDDLTGPPEIRLQPTSTPSSGRGDWEFFGIVDPNGRFRIGKAPQGSWMLEVRTTEMGSPASGKTSIHRKSRIEIGPQGITRLRIGGSTVVTGRLQGGRPGLNRKVVLTSETVAMPASAPWQQRWLESKVDTDGRFRIGSVEPGEYDFLILQEETEPGGPAGPKILKRLRRIVRIADGDVPTEVNLEEVDCPLEPISDDEP